MARTRKQQYFNRPNKDILAISPISFSGGTAVSGITSANTITVTSTTTSDLGFIFKENGTNGNIGVGSALGNISSGINNNNQINSEHTLVVGLGNQIDFDCRSVTVVGDNNAISNKTTNSGILGGDNNTIEGVNNSWIIGTNNKRIKQSNEIWVGDSLHIVNGVVTTSYQFVDGGLDYNTNIDATNNYFVIDGMVDKAFEEFPDDPIHIVDGGQDTFL